MMIKRKGYLYIKSHKDFFMKLRQKKLNSGW